MLYNIFMKIISLNLSIKNLDFEKVANFLDREKADFVCFQEVNLTNFDFAEKINSAMNDSFKYIATEKVEDYTTSTGESYFQGQSFLSKIPIFSQKINLVRAGQDKHNRICQMIEVDIGGRKVKIANCHFANNAENPTQLQEILGLDPDMIIGDFNMKKSIIIEMRNLWVGYKLLAEDFDYVSFPSSQEFSQIDHCLYSHDFELKSFRFAEGLSDHNAIILEFDI